MGQKQINNPSAKTTCGSSGLKSMWANTKVNTYIKEPCQNVSRAQFGILCLFSFTDICVFVSKKMLNFLIGHICIT